MHQCFLSRSRFTPLMSMESGLSITGDCQCFYTGTSGLIPKRHRLDFLTLLSPFCRPIRKKYSNWMAILSTCETGTLDETILLFKMVHFDIKTQHLELVNHKCVTYAQPIPLSWKYIIDRVTLSERNSHRRSPFTLGHHLPTVGAKS